MARWAYTIDVRDAGIDDVDDDSDLPPVRNKLVTTIKASQAYTSLKSAQVTSIVERMARADTLHRFNKVWHEFYDWADVNRVWVKTF